MSKGELQKLQEILEGENWLLDDTDGTSIMAGNIYKLKVENGYLFAEMIKKTSLYGISTFKSTTIAGFRRYEGGIHINTKSGAEFWFLEGQNV